MEKLFKASDANKDGKISVEEFCNYVFSDATSAIHTWHLKDGRVQQKFIDGRTRVTFPDGCTIDAYKNGLKIQTDVDGTTLMTDPDGLCQTSIMPDGTCVTESADGQVFTRKPDGTSITQDPSGTCVQIDPQGDRTITNPDGRTTTHFANGAIVERFGMEQSAVSGVTRVQRCASGALIVTYSDATKVQFTPSDGVLLETKPDGMTTLQRFADGSGVRHHKKTPHSDQRLSAQDIDAEIARGSSKLPLQAAMPPVVEFSSIASALNCEIMSTPASPVKKSSLRVFQDESPRLDSGPDSRDSPTSPSPQTVDQLTGGGHRITYEGGLVVDEHPDGTVLETQSSGQSKQINPDGTIILVDKVVATQTTLRPNGTSITKHADGHTVQKNADGTTIVKAADGVMTQIDPDGSRIVTLPNGEKTSHFADGTIVQIWPNGEKHQTFPDGCTVATHRDGSSEQIDPDGTKITALADGSSTMVKPNGVKIVALASGERLQTDPDGCQIRTFPNGRKVQKNAAGVILEILPDGTLRQCNPNGSGFVLTSTSKTQKDFAAGTLTASLDGIRGIPQKFSLPRDRAVCVCVCVCVCACVCVLR